MQCLLQTPRAIVSAGSDDGNTTREVCDTRDQIDHINAREIQILDGMNTTNGENVALFGDYFRRNTYPRDHVSYPAKPLQISVEDMQRCRMLLAARLRDELTSRDAEELQPPAPKYTHTTDIEDVPMNEDGVFDFDESFVSALTHDSYFPMSPQSLQMASTIPAPLSVHDDMHISLSERMCPSPFKSDEGATHLTLDRICCCGERCGESPDFKSEMGANTYLPNLNGQPASLTMQPIHRQRDNDDVPEKPCSPTSMIVTDTDRTTPDAYSIQSASYRSAQDFLCDMHGEGMQKASSMKSFQTTTERRSPFVRFMSQAHMDMDPGESSSSSSDESSDGEDDPEMIARFRHTSSWTSIGRLQLYLSRNSSDSDDDYDDMQTYLSGPSTSVPALTLDPVRGGTLGSNRAQKDLYMHQTAFQASPAPHVRRKSLPIRIPQTRKSAWQPLDLAHIKTHEFEEVPNTTAPSGSLDQNGNPYATTATHSNNVCESMNPTACVIHRKLGSLAGHGDPQEEVTEGIFGDIE
jgi:hypothetical protein